MLLLAPTGTHRRAYPFFIIGIDHRLLFYNNRRAAAVAPLAAALRFRRTPFAMPEEEESSPRLLFSGGGGRERVPEGYRDKSPMAGSDVDFARVHRAHVRLLRASSPGKPRVA